MFTKTILLFVTMTFVVIGLARQKDQGGSVQAFKASFLQAYAQYESEINSIFEEEPYSSIMDKGRFRRIAEAGKKYLVPFGPQVLPYLIVLSQENLWLVKSVPDIRGWYVGVVPAISKFQPHNIILSRIPKKLLSTTEEFPEIVEKYLSYHPMRVYLLWWLEGGQRTPQWFSERYVKWLAAKQQGNVQEVQAMYQRLLDIGIAAIPLWFEKLQSEQDQNIRQEIIKALSYLTDGEIKLNMSPQECLNWWKTNKERWTVSFPKSKREFLEWLEREGWEEPRLSIPCVITISRLEDEGAIDALLRFLRHPSSSVREISLGQIMLLFGEQLPREYALGVGTDEWERVGDLMEIGKYDWVRKRVMKAKKQIEDKTVADKIAKELSDWWKENKGRVKIYWQRAWENL